MTEDAGGDGENGGPNKTKNGSAFTMPRIYIISRNLRHFRPPRSVPPLVLAGRARARDKGKREETTVGEGEGVGLH